MAESCQLTVMSYKDRLSMREYVHSSHYCYTIHYGMCIEEQGRALLYRPGQPQTHRGRPVQCHVRLGLFLFLSLKQSHEVHAGLEPTA